MRSAIRTASYLTGRDLTAEQTARANAILADARAKGLSFAGDASYREGVRRRVRANPNAGKSELLSITSEAR